MNDFLKEEISYIVVKTREDFNRVIKILKSFDFRSGNFDKYLNRYENNNTYIKIYCLEKAYNVFSDDSMVLGDHQYSLEEFYSIALEYQKSILVDKIKEFFNNQDTCIYCDNYKEKYNLIKILEILNYKSATDRDFKDIDNISNVDKYIRPGCGTQGTIEFAKREGYKLIKFKDILIEIGLEEIYNQYKK